MNDIRSVYYSKSKPSTSTNGRVPGSETVENILDACRESFMKLENYFNISSDYCIIAIVLDP